MGSSTNLAPSGFSRHEEDVLGGVFVLIFRVGVFVALQLLELLFEAVADVFQKDESEHHALVLRSAEVASQNVGSLPYFLFKTNADGILFLSHDCLFINEHKSPVCVAENVGTVCAGYCKYLIVYLDFIVLDGVRVASAGTDFIFTVH